MGAFRSHELFRPRRQRGADRRLRHRADCAYPTSPFLAQGVEGARARSAHNEENAARTGHCGLRSHDRGGGGRVRTFAILPVVARSRRRHLARRPAGEALRNQRHRDAAGAGRGRPSGRRSKAKLTAPTQRASGTKARSRAWSWARASRKAFRARGRNAPSKPRCASRCAQGCPRRRTSRRSSSTRVSRIRGRAGRIPESRPDRTPVRPVSPRRPSSGPTTVGAKQVCQGFVSWNREKSRLARILVKYAL